MYTYLVFLKSKYRVTFDLLFVISISFWSCTCSSRIEVDIKTLITDKIVIGNRKFIVSLPLCYISYYLKSLAKNETLYFLTIISGHYYNRIIMGRQN